MSVYHNQNVHDVGEHIDKGEFIGITREDNWVAYEMWKYPKSPILLFYGSYHY